MENNPPPFPSPLPPPDDARLRAGAVIRDVVILWVLTMAAGFVIGFINAILHPGVRPSVAAIALCNLGFGLLAFTISGSLVPPAVRWKHLAVVALIAWLTSLVNVMFFGATITNWVFSAFFFVLLMGVGGAISCLFNRGPKPSA